MKKYTRLYGKSFMFWFLHTRFGPEYFLKMNIIVNISDLHPCSHCYKNVILELDLYILLKSVLKMQEMPFQRPSMPGPPYKCVVTV